MQRQRLQMNQSIMFWDSNTHTCTEKFTASRKRDRNTSAILMQKSINVRSSKSNMSLLIATNA